jgi:hypothetical protein
MTTADFWRVCDNSLAHEEPMALAPVDSPNKDGRP